MPGSLRASARRCPAGRRPPPRPRCAARRPGTRKPSPVRSRSVSSADRDVEDATFHHAALDMRVAVLRPDRTGLELDPRHHDGAVIAQQLAADAAAQVLPVGIPVQDEDIALSIHGLRPFLKMISAPASRRRPAGWRRARNPRPARRGTPPRRPGPRARPSAGRDALQDLAVAGLVGLQGGGVVGGEIAGRDRVDVDARAPPIRWPAAWSARQAPLLDAV